MEPVEQSEAAVEARPTMNSRQKVLAALAQIDAIDTEDANPGLQGALLAATVMRPHIMGALPEDPTELDEMLLAGAQWFLALRGDDAQQFHIGHGAEAEQ